MTKEISFSSKLRDLGSDSENIIDITPPAFPLRPADFVPTLVLIIGLTVGAIISVTIGYIYRTRILEPADRGIDSGWLRRNIEHPITRIVIRWGQFIFGKPRSKRK